MTQIGHCRDAWCFRSQSPALQCWASSTRLCTGGGYGELHPACELLRQTPSREPLQSANRATLRTGTAFNSVLNGPHVVLRVTGRHLCLFTPKPQYLGKQFKLQHRAEVSSHVCKNDTRTVVWSTVRVSWEVVDCCSPLSFKIRRNGHCPSLFLWKVPKPATNRNGPSHLLRHPVQQKDRLFQTKGEEVTIYTPRVVYGVPPC